MNRKNNNKKLMDDRIYLLITWNEIIHFAIIHERKKINKYKLIEL